MLKSKFIIFTLTSFLVFDFTFCQLFPTKIKIKHLEPARYNIGKKPDISIIEIDGGRRNQQDAFLEQLIKQSRSGSFFTIKDRNREGIQFNFIDDQPKSVGKNIDLSKDQYFLTVEILETFAEDRTEEREVKVKNSEGKTVKIKKTFDIIYAEAAVSITLISQNKIFFEDKEFVGSDKKDKENAPSKDEIKELAIANSITKLLEMITPKYQTNSFAINKKDKGQKNIYKAIKKGKNAVARELLEDYIKTNSNQASAYYNLGLLVDAAGEYDLALEYYNSAIALDDNSKFQDAKTSCMGRINARDSFK